MLDLISLFNIGATILRPDKYNNNNNNTNIKKYFDLFEANPSKSVFLKGC